MKLDVGVAVVAGAAALASTVLVPSGAARAAPLAVIEGQTLDVSADRLDVDVERDTAALDGHVSLTFGDLQIRCPSVDLRYDRSPRVSFAKGSGGVSAHYKGVDISADTMEFDASSRTVALSGSVRLSRGRGWIAAERASLDISTGKVSLEAVKGSIPVEPLK